MVSGAYPQGKAGRPACREHAYDFPTQRTSGGRGLAADPDALPSISISVSPVGGWWVHPFSYLSLSFLYHQSDNNDQSKCVITFTAP